MSVPDMSAWGARIETRPLTRRLMGPARLAIGALLCLTPLTAVIVLGWLMRLMQAEGRRWREVPAGARPPRAAGLPHWITGAAGDPRLLWRWFGGLIDNIRLGLAALITLAASTLPFMLLWLFSWWSGWENSFNKGYEQAWIGPVIWLAGTIVSLPLLARLPMALAHQAAEGRKVAFFAGGEVRALIDAAGWRYVLLAAVSVLVAVAILLLRAAPVFVEAWWPGFTGLDADGVAAFARRYHLIAGIIAFVAVLLLRRWAARLHGRASRVLEQGVRRGAGRMGTLMRHLLLWLIWLALPVLIVVGQFFHHHWWAWVAHPLIGLPWLPG